MFRTSVMRVCFKYSASLCETEGWEVGVGVEVGWGEFGREKERRGLL